MLFTANADLNSFDLLVGVAEALQHLGVNVRDLPNASSRMNWVQSFKNSIFSLEGNQPQTTLFLIDAWLNITDMLQQHGEVVYYLDSTFINRLSAFQDENGAFSIFFTRVPDIQGTYLAAKFYKRAGHDIPRIPNLTSLLDKLALNHGGFSVLKSPSSSGSSVIARSVDTNLSLEIQTMLGIKADNQPDNIQLREYTQECIHDLLMSTDDPLSLVKETYYTILLAQRFSLSTTLLRPLVIKEASALIDNLKGNKQINRVEFNAAYYLTQIVSFEPSANQQLVRSISNLINQTGAYGGEGIYTLQFTWLALSALNNLGENVASLRTSQKTVSWILQHRAPGGGYIEYTSENSPDIYSSYCAMESLHILGSKATSDIQLINWVKSLKQPDGGFLVAPHSQNSPFIFTTYYGLSLEELMTVS
jgi:hypothetical protein